MKGIFAFDVALVRNARRGYPFPCDRMQPALQRRFHPTVIAQKLDIPEWSAMTFKTKYRTLPDLDLRDLEFDMQTGEGLVIVNWGTLLKGKLVLLLAGSYDYQEALRNELLFRLG